MVSDHVLIVDDEASIRQILARWIKAIGYETIEADCRRGRPRRDDRESGSGGFLRCADAGTRRPLAGRRSAHAISHAAIVLATGVSTVPATTSLRPGILAYLTKPFDEPGVRDALQRAMVWHDAAVASGAHKSQPADPDAGLQAWLDSLE